MSNPMRKTPFVILSTLAALFLLFLTPPSSQVFAQLDAPIAADGESRFFYHETPLTRNGLELHLSRVTKEFVEPTRDILLIHGLTYSSHVFNVDYEDYSLVRRLANFGYRVWRLDVAGYGRSERPDDGFLPNTEYAVEDIHAAVEAICKFERVDQIDLLGWSWGTITTSAFANRYPERVRRLVLYAPIFKGIGEAQVDDAYHANSWEHASEDFQRDENGEIVNGDKIMYICGKYLKSIGQLPSNKVVTTVMSNFGLYKALDRIGISYEKTAVGDRYVYENMKEFNHMIGGEQSGHVIFRKYARTGDGILTAIMLLSVLVETQLPLSVLASEVTMYPQVLKNVVVDDKDGTLEDPAVKLAVEAATAELGDNGRVLLRKSGTEPVLRVMSEAGSNEECEKHVDAIIESMKVSGHLIKIK